MKLVLSTSVYQPMESVWAGFDQNLFNQLSPPWPPVDIVRFDGCLRGDVVTLRLNFLLFSQEWKSIITDQQDTANEIYFVDQGTKLPFFLAYWHHRHRLCRHPSGGTCIIDDITFRTPYRLTDYLMYPIMWLQFAYRKPIYRRVFGAKTS